MAEIEVQIDFSDITLAETNGVFAEVDALMSQEPPYSGKWVIRSNVTIMSPSGVGEMIIQCHGDGRVYIIEYNPSIRDVFYNNDIAAISQWCQENGWKIPEPHYDIVETNKSFWKYFWETLLIDSSYLDKLYGQRDQIGDNDE